MYTDPCTIVLQTDSQLMTIHESKFLIYGEHHRDNGWVMRDCLGYIAQTEDDAIDKCRRNQPQFVIQSITIEN